MKQTIFGMVCVLMLTFFVVIFMTLYGRNLRQSETDHTLAEALDTAMETLMEERVYTVDSKEVFVADLLQILLAQMNSTSDVTVSILKADEEKGILSVEVTEKFKHPNGKDGTVSAVRTIILDKDKEQTPEQHTVEFYTADGELYKRYTLQKDSMCALPVEPVQEGKTFSGWRFVTGGSGVAEAVTAELRGSSRTVLGTGGVPYTVAEDTRLIAIFE